MKNEQKIWTALIVVGGLWLVFRVMTAEDGVGTVHVTESDGTWVSVASDSDDVIVGAAELSWTRTLGTWAAALFTLAIFSFLYRDNPFYKIAESVVVGVSAAYWMVVAFWTTLIPNLVGNLHPEWTQSWAMPGLSPIRAENWYWYFVPAILCIMLLWRLAPAGAWISRWPLAFTIGAFAGLRFVSFIQADFLSQIRSSIAPVVVLGDGGAFDFWASARNVTMLISVLCCLVYFFFSFEHKGVVGRISRVGIWVLMITFGAAFGYTVMGRIALLAIRLEFLFTDWLGVL